MKKALLIATGLIFLFSIHSNAQDTTSKNQVFLSDSMGKVSSMPANNTVPDRSIATDPGPKETTQRRQPVYRIKLGIDLPLTIAGDAWSLYGMSVIYNRDTIPVSEVMTFKREKINGLDRSVSYNYSKQAAKISDYFFYGSMPLPLVLLFDKRIRKDGPKVGLLYLEAVGITGGLYVTSAMLAKRIRPYGYNPKVNMATRTRGGARNSFFAGHVAVVATSVFFTAQVYVDYHPEMKHKWIIYSAAGAISTFTGAMRIAAGQHFYTDVATGLVIGTLSGLLTPYIHKQKIFGERLTILPRIQQSGSGFSLIYKLDKPTGRKS